MPPSLSFAPAAAPAAGATRRAGWLLPAGLLFSLLLLGRWSQLPAAGATRPAAVPSSALGRLPQPLLAPASAL